MGKFERAAAIPKIDVRRGIRMQPEAADSLPALANGDRALRSILEHDPHYMPVGKIAECTVEETETDFILKATVDDTHEVRRFRRDGEDTQLVEVSFVNDNRPFLHQSLRVDSGVISVYADPINFQNPTGFDTFLAEINNPLGFADSVCSMHLRAFDPAPIVQLVIDHPVLSSALGWVLWRGQKFLAYTVDETLRKVGDQISDEISSRIKNVIGKYNEHRAGDDRNATAHIVVNGDVEINLLTRCPDIERHTELGLVSLCKQIERIKDLVESAESVTFTRNDETEEWELLYIETSDGNVIATAECYQSTVDAYQTLRRSFPICLCLENKNTGEEMHYKTFARFDPLGDPGNYRMTIDRFPQDIAQWLLVNIALEIDVTPDPGDQQ